MLQELMDGNEQEVYADSGYTGKKIAPLLGFLDSINGLKSIRYASKKIASLLGDKNRILHRPYRNTPLTERQRQENATRRKTRNVIERTFTHLKLHFGLTKARYLGLTRNHAFALLTAIAYNLKRAIPKIKIAL